MRFLFVTEYFPPFVRGGAEISLEILVEELVKNNHEVKVLTPNYSSFETEIEKKGSLKIIRFKSFRSFLFKKRERTSHEVYKKTKPIFYLLLEQYLKYSSYELKKNTKYILKKEKFDVIHANNLESILALNNIKTSAKKIAHLRDFGLFCYNRGLDNSGKLCKGCSEKNLKSCMNAKEIVNKLLLMEMKRRINILSKLSSFDLLVAISKFVKQQYVDIFGADKNRIEVMYNPISPHVISDLSKDEARKLLNLPKDRKIVLFVGSLTEEKGAHLIPKIAKKLKEYLFVVIGDGIMKDLFLKNRQKNIKYFGYLPISKIKHYYKASDVLLVPSIWHEPFGRVCIEAMINGIPCIVSNRGALPEVVRNAGIVIDNILDINSWIQAIRILNEDTKLYNKLSERTKRRAKIFDFERQYKKFKLILKQLIS